MTPRTNFDEDDDFEEEGGGKENNETKAMITMFNDRFLELEAALNKRLMPGMMILQEDTMSRLEAIERNNLELKKTLIKDAQGKFAKVKDEL